MERFRFKFDFGEIAAISTWAVVYGITLYFMLSNNLFQDSIALVSTLFMVYLACFVFLGQPISDNLSTQDKAHFLQLKKAAELKKKSIILTLEEIKTLQNR